MSSQNHDVAIEVMRLATAWAVGIEQWNAPARVQNRAALDAYAKSTAARIAALEAQNAELLAALQACIDYGCMTGAEWVAERAVAAAAKATRSAS